MQQPLISVIIPFYNEERFLEQCLESVVNQTYRNLQIIVVDDGSRDASPQMADAWAQRDERIEVIHQSNKGLSGARNTGMEYVRGELLAFLDSDDWMSPNHLEDLYKAMYDARADMASCALLHCFEDGTFKKITNGMKKPTVWSGKRAFCELIMDKILSNHVHNKLFKTSLWKEVRFPEGKVYEDIYVMPLIFEQIERHVHNAQATLHYRQHNRSISHTRSKKNELDYFDACKVRFDYLQQTSWCQKGASTQDLLMYSTKGMLRTLKKIEDMPDSEKEVDYMKKVLDERAISYNKIPYNIQMFLISLRKRRIENQVRRVWK